MATRKKSMLRTWAEREAERVDSANAVNMLKRPSGDFAEGITQDVLDASKAEVAEAMKAWDDLNREAPAVPPPPPLAPPAPVPSIPAQPAAVPAPAGIAPAPVFKQKPINDTSYEDQGFSRRDNARNNFLADTTNKGVQVVNPMGGTNAIGDKWQAWGTQAKGAPAPAAPAVAVNDGRIHWENLGSHYQKPGIQPAQTAQPTAVAAAPTVNPAHFGSMDALAGPSQTPGVAPSATPPVVQQEPKAQATPGSPEVFDAIANGSKGSNQRKQSVADFVLKRKLPSELPGSRSWRSGNNPNAIKPAGRSYDTRDNTYGLSAIRPVGLPIPPNNPNFEA